MSTLGKEIATHYVDNSTAPTVALLSSGRYTLNTVDIGKASTNVTAVTSTAGTTPHTIWCVQVTYTGGTKTTIAYSGAAGMGAPGSTCSSAV